MVIIGFDPGLTNTGYAVLRKKNNDISLIECGLINPKKSKIISERLYTIFNQASDLIKKFEPSTIFVENVGLLYLGGKNQIQAKSYVLDRFSKVYATLNSNQKLTYL